MKIAFEVSTLVVAPPQVNAGIPVTVSFRVTNIGNVTASYEIPLLFDGTAVFTASGSMAPEASRAHETTVASTQPGTHTVQAGELVGSFIVLSATIKFSNLNVSPRTVGPGDPVTVSITVANTGGAPGDYNATLTIAGVQEATPSGTLAAGQTKTLAFTVSRSEPGTYAVSIANLANSFTVTAPLKVAVTELRLDTGTKVDVSASKPTLGSVAFAFTTNQLGAQPKTDAYVTMTGKEQPSATAKAAISLIARDAGNNVTFGATVEIDTNLVNGIDIGSVDIRIAASEEWVAQQGGPSFVHITRLAGDGSLQFLATVLLPDRDAEGRMVFQATSPDGFSIFTLVSAAPIPANFVVTDLVLDPPVAEPKEVVAITAKVANRGGQAGTWSVLLTVNGKPMDTLDITLDAGKEGEVLFFLTQAEVGTYRVQVEEQTRTLEVAKVVSPALISYVDLSVAPKEVGPNEPVTVTVRITNSGDEVGRLDIKVLLNHVLFQIRPTSLPGQVTGTVTFPLAVELPGNYTVSIGGLTDSFSAVKRLAPAALAVSRLDIRPTEVKPGERVTILVMVGNTGDVEGSFDVVLLVNGQQEARETVTLPGLGITPVIFDVTRTKPGTYNVQIEDLKGSFNVLSVPTAVFTLSNLQVSPAKVTAGEDVTMTADLANTGDAAGSLTVTLKVNGVVEKSQDVTLSAGGSRTVEFTVTRDEPGVYNVEIDGQLATFEVTPAPGPPIGLIIVIVVVVLLLVAGGSAAYYFLVLRRRPPAP